jgi:hypothetical protein
MLSDPVVATFVVLPVLVVIAFVAGVHRGWRAAGLTAGAAGRAALIAACAAAAWMWIAWIAAASGVIAQWDRTPPPLAFLVLSIVLLAAAIAFTRVGDRLALLPLWGLVGLQSFRLPLELAMHAMAERGVMPEVMSYSGRNFDIVTGATALVLAPLLAGPFRHARAVAQAWNAFGLVLLVNVVVVAILATPRFRVFGDEQLNTWVADPPFIWLPAVLVLAALAGHLVIFRALARRE